MKGLAIIIATLLLSGCAATIEPVILTNHTSDLWTPPPEPTADYVGGGVTVSWHHIEVDLTHGLKAMNCVKLGQCSWESGSQISVRTYPFRKRR